MACKVVYTETFGREYDRVLDYLIAQLHAPQAAQSLMTALEEACSLLESSPELGSISTKPLLENLELREWLVRNYIIVYRLDDDCLYLEHIFHQSQDFEALV